MASVAYGKFYRWQTYDKCNNGTSIMTNETEPIVQLLHGLPGGHYHEPFHRLGFFNLYSQPSESQPIQPIYLIIIFNPRYIKM